MKSVAKFGQSFFPVNGVLELFEGELIIDYLVCLLNLLIGGDALVYELEMVEQEPADGEHENECKQPHQHVHNKITHDALRVRADYDRVGKPYCKA